MNEWASLSECSHCTPPKTLSGWGMGVVECGSHTPASIKAAPLPWSHCEIPLRSHLNKGSCHCEMFETHHPRASGPANLRPRFLLVAPITFTSQWSDCLNCFPFTGKTTPKPQIHFPPSLLHWAFFRGLGHLAPKRRLLLLSEIPSTSSKAVTPAWRDSSQESRMTFLGKIPERHVGN